MSGAEPMQCPTAGRYAAAVGWRTPGEKRTFEPGLGRVDQSAFDDGRPFLRVARHSPATS